MHFFKSLPYELIVAVTAIIALVTPFILHRLQMRRAEADRKRHQLNMIQLVTSELVALLISVKQSQSRLALIESHGSIPSPQLFLGMAVEIPEHLESEIGWVYLMPGLVGGRIAIGISAIKSFNADIEHAFELGNVSAASAFDTGNVQTEKLEMAKLYLGSAKDDLQNEVDLSDLLLDATQRRDDS